MYNLMFRAPLISNLDVWFHLESREIRLDSRCTPAGHDLRSHADYFLETELTLPSSEHAYMQTAYDTPHLTSLTCYSAEPHHSPPGSAGIKDNKNPHVTVSSLQKYSGSKVQKPQTKQKIALKRPGFWPMGQGPTRDIG